MSNPTVKYRPEIDGLRAIAVLSVILFHAGFKSFSGGFVGVDVFFVISGFLITTILIKDQERGGISIIKFYQRRAKRIMPALFVVILATMPLAWVFLPPEELKSYFSSIAATATFSSNILFWYESGYWDTATTLKPLIHTWSLAVEEQYYIVFPLLVMAVWRLGRAWFAVITLALVAASMWFAEHYLATDPMMSFYMLPARAWELLVGSLTALYLLRRAAPISSGPLNQALSLSGLSMIVYAILAYNEQTPFPGINAALPVIGTALIIAATGPRTLVGVILSSRPFVMIGLISYSAYLWHQPILAIFKLRSFGELSAEHSAIAISFTLLLSILSYRLVEKPVRNGASALGKRPIASTAIAIVTLISVASYGYVKEGFPERLDSVYSINSQLIENANRKLFIEDTDPQSDKPVVLIVGDSYLTNWSIGISSQVDKSRYRVISVSYLGCKFSDISKSLKASPTESRYTENCETFSKVTSDRKLLDSTEKIFIVSHRPFSYRYNMYRFDLYKKLKNETGADLYVFGNYFQLDVDKKQSCLSTMFISKNSAKSCIDAATYDGSEPYGKYSSRMRAPYTYIDVKELVCSILGSCPYDASGVPFITDANHMTATFLISVMKDIASRRSDYLKSVGLGDVFLKDLPVTGG